MSRVWSPSWIAEKTYGAGKRTTVGLHMAADSDR
jgi:hypothetical protein